MEPIDFIAAEDERVRIGGEGSLPRSSSFGSAGSSGSETGGFRSRLGIIIFELVGAGEIFTEEDDGASRNYPFVLAPFAVGPP